MNVPITATMFTTMRNECPNYSNNVYNMQCEPYCPWLSLTINVRQNWEASDAGEFHLNKQSSDTWNIDYKTHHDNKNIKTERAMKNGQHRDTGKTDHKTQKTLVTRNRSKTIKTNPKHRKLTRSAVNICAHKV